VQTFANQGTSHGLGLHHSLKPLRVPHPNQTLSSQIANVGQFNPSYQSNQQDPSQTQSNLQQMGPQRIMDETNL